MIILGIDPGTATIGYGVICFESNEVSYGVIQIPNYGDKGKRLSEIHSSIRGIIKEFTPDKIAVEELFFSNNAKTAMAVAESRGVILLAAYLEGFDVMPLKPNVVKKAVTGKGNAKKAVVQAKVADILDIEQPASDDAADALAIAITCHRTVASYLAKY